MDAAWKDRLPADLAEAVEAMEDMAGGEVKVERDGGLTAAIIVIRPGRGRIRISYGPAGLADHDLAHEVMHGRRNLLDRVPRLVPINAGRFAGWVTTLENDLEHLFVVPEEMALFAAAEPAWGERYARVLAEREAGPGEDSFGCRFDLLRHALLLENLLPRSTLCDRMRNLLDRYGLAAEARRFVAAIAEAGDDKARMIAAAVRQFPFLRGSAAVESFVGKDGGVGFVRVPVASV